MSAKRILTELITNDTDIQALIAGRFQPQESPKNAGFPRISYTRLATEWTTSTDDNPESEVTTESLEILCHDLTDLDADTLASLVLRKLKQWVRDNVGEESTSVAGYDVTNLWFVDRSDEPSRPLLSDNQPNYTDVLSVHVSYRQGTNT